MTPKATVSIFPKRGGEYSTEREVLIVPIVQDTQVVPKNGFEPLEHFERLQLLFGL
jgi:hypothetical protein